MANNKPNDFADRLADRIAEEAEEALFVGKTTPSRFGLVDEVRSKLSVGVIAGVSGGIAGALSMYVRDDVHPVAAITGAAVGSAVGYAVGRLLTPIEIFGPSGKILAGAAGFFNGAGIAMGTTDLVNSFIGAPVSDADL